MKRSLLFLLFIPIIFNIGEIFSSELNKNNSNLIFIILYLISLSIIIIQPSIFTNNKINLPGKILHRLFYLGFLGIIPLTFFIISNIKGFDIISIVQFMEEYRNAYYKGSGIYTFTATNIFPLVYCYFLYHYNIKFSHQFIFGFLSIIPPFFLGLRVWLIPLFIVYSINIFSSKELKLQNIFILFIVSVILIFSTKLVLAPELYTEDFIGSIMKILTRTNYQSILIDKYDINIFIEFLKNLNFYESKQYLYYNNQFQIDSLYLNNIGNISGIAIPLSVFIFNCFGTFLGTIILTSIIFFILFCLNQTLNLKNTFILKSLFFYLALFLISSIIEDSIFITKFWLIPFLLFFKLFIIHFPKVKFI